MYVHFVCMCPSEQSAGVLSTETSAISGGPLAVILGTSATINTFLNSGAKTESPGSPEFSALILLSPLSPLFLNYFLFFSLRARGNGKRLHGLCESRDI